MKYILIAVLFSIPIPAQATQRLVSLGTDCTLQHTCSPIEKFPRGLRLANGTECPVGSKTYCGDDLPYCCYAPSSKTYYCATDVTHCTRP